jgi:hypothetical protein
MGAKEAASVKPLDVSTTAASTAQAPISNGAKAGASLAQSTPASTQKPSAIVEESKAPAKTGSTPATQAKPAAGQSAQPSASQNPVAPREVAKPTAPVLSLEETKQLDDLKKKIAEKKVAKKTEEDTLQDMERLVALKH